MSERNASTTWLTTKGQWLIKSNFPHFTRSWLPFGIQSENVTSRIKGIDAWDHRVKSAPSANAPNQHLVLEPLSILHQPTPSFNTTDMAEDIKSESTTSSSAESLSDDQSEASDASTESSVTTLDEYDLNECGENSDDDYGDVADVERVTRSLRKYAELKHAIFNSLNEVNSIWSFACTDTFLPTFPGLKVKGLDEIGLPLSSRDALALSGAGPSSSQTKAWKIDTGKFELANLAWDVDILKLHSSIIENLDLNCLSDDIQTCAYQLQLHGGGQHLVLDKKYE